MADTGALCGRYVHLDLPETTLSHRSPLPSLQVGVFKIHPEIPETLSAEARAFVLSCFEPDPHKRVTAAGLLQEGFLRQVNKGQKNRIAFKPAGEACWDGRGDGSPER